MITAKAITCNVFNYFENNTKTQLSQLNTQLRRSIKTKNTLNKVLHKDTLVVDLATAGDAGPFDWVMFSLAESSSSNPICLLVLTKQLERFYKLEDTSDSDIIEPCHILVKHPVSKHEAIKALTQWIKDNFNKNPKIIIKE